MNIKNKALSLVLALTMLVGTFSSTAAFAAEESTWDSNFDSGSIHYHVTDSNFTNQDSGTVEITYVDSGYDSYNIPQQVTYQDSNYNVTEITGNAFDNTFASSITAVIKDSNISLTVGTKGTGYVGLAAEENGAITATAIPSDGYQLDGWYKPDGVNCISSALSLALTDNTGYELIAKFKVKEPVVSFTSDTTRDFTVNGSYQFKITSKDGKIPTFVVGTAGVFRVDFVLKANNDYYYKLTVIGKPGAKAGVYVNGVKLLVATAGRVTSSVRCDTTNPFKIKSGAGYIFKFTADKKPTFITGTSSAFKVVFVRTVGKDYFFKVTAIGKAGVCSGFYLNSYKTPFVIVTISR